jgi:hypothetical protein
LLRITRYHAHIHTDKHWKNHLSDTQCASPRKEAKLRHMHSHTRRLEVTSLQDALAVVDRRHTRELRERNERVHELQADYVTAKRENDELKTANERLRGEVNDTRSRMAVLQEDIEGAHADSDGLRARCSGLQMKLDRMMSVSRQVDDVLQQCACMHEDIKALVDTWYEGEKEKEVRHKEEQERRKEVAKLKVYAEECTRAMVCCMCVEKGVRSFFL